MADNKHPGKHQTSFFGIDSCFTEQREDFRQYLENGGVPQMLTRVFTELFLLAEKPEDPFDFITSYLTERKLPNSDFDMVRNELIATRNKLRFVERQVLELKRRLSMYEEMESNESCTATSTTDD